LYRKSSYSGYNGNCVEVEESQGAFRLRDSKNPCGPILEFTAAEWEEFTGRIKAGVLNYGDLVIPARWGKTSQ
jgi:Domain of unknown function (DUF397)